jgi:hypothetical protein
MAYRAYRSDRRFRKRRWLLIVVSLVAIISVIAFLVSRQTEQRGAVEFFASADESSAEHSAASVELESVLASIGVADRQDLTRRLQNVADTAADADALLDLDVPSPIGASYGTMTTASAAWKSGAEAVGTAITAIMDGALVEGAQEQLQSALDLLRVGDVSYSLFRSTLVELSEDVEIPSFSRVVYINPDAQDPLLYDAQTLVLRILSSYVLSPHHDVAVTGMTNPEPVGESGGILVVPFSESLDIQAVVSNVGNEDESSVDVELEMFDIDNGSILKESQTVTDLTAGSSTTVTFTDLAIAPGRVYQARVVGTVAEDIDLDNNVWEMTFIWRDES